MVEWFNHIYEMEAWEFRQAILMDDINQSISGMYGLEQDRIDFIDMIHETLFNYGLGGI